MYCLARSVVAPWFGPCAQVQSPRIMPHQMPMYLAGSNQLTSPSLFGSLRLSSRSFSTSPAASSAMRIVRHGVVKAPSRTTFAPREEGASCERKRVPSIRRSHMPE